ncbi:alpha-L-rhamnosidase [Dictyobacter alpinus]|uniref:alpha-L-rhamnosidase n=1 Tax=Dictyobacter alpinus TaxID=2014873 RepID=A0A402BGH6_9CHLR|nr:glycoside hydrolase family 78 protein [Dictyobacter alpinus]GCE30362.1 alpha-L-rhamnosidase [Dictyobacter alpinus]
MSEFSQTQTSQEANSHPLSSHLSITAIHFEHLRDALGIGTEQPRISWITTASVTGWQQAGYEIEAYDPAGQVIGQTGHITSTQSVLLPWPFAPLTSRARVSIRVRVWGENNEASDWSPLTTVEAGLLHAEDWSAQFVTPEKEEDTSHVSSLVRRSFKLRGAIAQARLYISALGVYEAWLNGAVVGDHVLAPGWTSYRHRLRYQTFDVTNLLQEGDNTLGAILGDGWYRGRLGFGGGQQNIYGEHVALLAQLEVIYTDGSSERIISDENWRSAASPIIASNIYDGETYDARLELAGWSEADFHDQGWSNVRPLDWDFNTLIAPSGPPIRRIELISPVAITTTPSGRTLIDFGQNLVGRLRITVQGERGQTITLRHAEVLENGELCTRPLRAAKATDHYILHGTGSEVWEPRFTFHGFRYAEVEGWPGTPDPDAIRAVVCHSDLERTGWFECSDPLINQLHANIVWSMRGNFLDVPTDCPQRDERLGWTGDIQIFAPTACFLYASAGFLSSWLADLAAEQSPDGNVPFVIPNVLEGQNPPATAWGDATVIVPWVLYQRYGDSDILTRQFASMRAWVDLLARISGEKYLWDYGFQFGDWLDPIAPPDNPGAARTSPYVIATIYFAHSAELLGRAAGIIGRTEEEAHYLGLADHVRTAFAREYVTPNGRVISDSTTAYALALQFGLLPDAEQRQHAGERLAEVVRKDQYRISTGFVGTPLVCDALCSVGAYDDAFKLLTQRECPSWLYPVTMGATTIWERWDSMLPDGSINPGEMTSFNHYALGAIADWLHRTVAGLEPAAPGYRQLTIAPHPGGGLTYARARHQTPYGMAASSWQIQDGQIEISVEVPASTSATVILPGKQAETIQVASGTHRWTYPYQPATS